MNNVREGKIDSSVRLLFKKGESKALLLSGATARVIDLKELPKRLVSDLVTEPEVQITAETPLVSPQYASNVAVMGASAAAGFDVTQAPPVMPTATSTEPTETPEIVPVSFAVPPIQEPPLQETVQPAVGVNDVPVVPEPAAQEPQSVLETQPLEQVVPAIDPVKLAIDQELVNPPVKEVTEQPVLQTPQEFNQTETDNSKEVSGAYVNVIDEMLKIKEKHLRELDKLKEEIDEKFRILSEKYKIEVDEAVRMAERARTSDLESIRKAVNNQAELLNNQYMQRDVNVR